MEKVYIQWQGSEGESTWSSDRVDDSDLEFMCLSDHKAVVEIMQNKIEELENSLDLINKDIFGTMCSSLDKDRYFKLRELCANHLQPKEIK